MINVPKLPGVPKLASYSSVVLGIQGTAKAWGIITEKPQWGIFDKNNNPVAIADTVVSFAIESASQVSDFPVERGGFASYNKVQAPDQHKVVMAKGGSKDDQSEFIQAIDKAKRSTDLFTVTTPQQTYFNATIESYAYSRTNTDGVGMTKVEIIMKEVREVTPQYEKQIDDDKVKNKASAGKKDVGRVTTKKATPKQVSKAKTKKPQVVRAARSEN